jgi:hypothetical protein
MVRVLVRRHDDVEAAAALLHQIEKARCVIGGVDQQLGTSRTAGQQVGVVVEGGDAALADRQAGQLSDVGGTTRGDVTRIRIGAHLSRARGSSAASRTRPS